MKIKKIIMYVLLFYCFTLLKSKAQDIIVLQIGDTIRCQIISIDTSIIKFNIISKQGKKVTTFTEISDVIDYKYSFYSTEKTIIKKPVPSFIDSGNIFIDIGFGLGNELEFEGGIFTKMRNNTLIGMQFCPGYMYTEPYPELIKEICAEHTGINANNFDRYGIDSWYNYELLFSIISLKYSKNKRVQFMKQIGIGGYLWAFDRIYYSYSGLTSSGTASGTGSIYGDFFYEGIGISVGAGIYFNNEKKSWRMNSIFPQARIIFINERIIPFITINFSSLINPYEFINLLY